MKKADLTNALINNTISSILIDGKDGLQEYKFDDLEIREVRNEKMFLVHKKS